MILCNACGANNQPGDAFCGSCGSFLEWNSQAPQASEPAPEQPHDLWSRARAISTQAAPADTAGLPPSAPTPSAPPAPSAPAPPTTTAAPPTPPSAPPARPTSPPPAPSSSPPPSERFPPALPTSSPGPAAPQPVSPADATPRAREPQRQVQRKVRDSQTREDVSFPGGPVCSQCGIGNPPNRLFCRRCGTPLVAAPVAARPSWWRRLLARMRRQPVAAGARPGRRRGELTGPPVRRRRRPRAGSLALLGVLAVIAGTFAGPWRSSVVNRVHSVVSHAKSAAHVVFVPVHPVGATATSTLPGHPAAAVIDTVRQTYWASAAPRSGVGQSLTLVLDGSSRLDKVRFISGASSDPGQFVTEPRVHSVAVVADGRTVATFTLVDTPNEQTFGVNLKSVHTITFVIRSVYAGTKGTATSVAEIELFRRQA